MLAQPALRAVLGQHELGEMLSERKKLSADVQSSLDSQTGTWGIKVSNVEIRTVELTYNMVRDCQTGGGGTRPAGKGHSRGGRISGHANLGERGLNPAYDSGRYSAALFADADR